MSVDVTIRVPDELGRQLEPFRDRLAEVLERGLQHVLAESASSPSDENAVITVLASQPTPDQVLAIGPSAEMQTRVSELSVEPRMESYRGRKRWSWRSTSFLSISSG
jgi:hypothetical protein